MEDSRLAEPHAEPQQALGKQSLEPGLNMELVHLQPVSQQFCLAKTSSQPVLSLGASVWRFVFQASNIRRFV
jgi:hypothetical protein